MKSRVPMICACLFVWSLLALGQMAFAQSEFTQPVLAQTVLAQGETEEMRRVAETSLREFVLPTISDKIRNSSTQIEGLPAPAQKDKEYTYGFLKEESIDNAQLGKPFRLHILKSSEVYEMNKSASIDINKLLHPANIWYYPVTLAEEGRCTLMLIKDTDTGEWRSAGFGEQPLACKLAKINKEWPVSQGYTPKLIQSYEPYDFLFTVPEMGTNNLTSLSKSSDVGQLDDASQIITEIYNAVYQRTVVRK